MTLLKYKTNLKGPRNSSCAALDHVQITGLFIAILLSSLSIASLRKLDEEANNSMMENMTSIIQFSHSMLHTTCSSTIH